MFTNAYVETNYSEAEKDEVIGRTMFRDVKKFVEVPRPVVVCQGEVRQAVAASVQKEEQKVVAEPTTLAGAVRAHNKLND